MSEEFDNRRKPPAASLQDTHAKELKAAGEALVGWFNQMEISKDDAEIIMSRVMAKLICARTRPDVFSLGEAVNDATFRLVNDMNARLHANAQVRWRKRNG